MPYGQTVRVTLAAVLLVTAVGLSACGTPDTPTTGAVPTAAPPTTAPSPTPLPTAPIVEPSATPALLPTLTPMPTLTPSPTPFPPPSPSVIATPSGPVQKVGEIVPDLTATSVHSISLQNDWTGLSPLAPIEAHYALERNGNDWSGQASFSVAGYSQHPRKAERSITIPAEAMQAFLGALAEAPAQEGTYVPTFTHTDDYPKIMIVVATAAGEVAIGSMSQGEGNVPWALFFDERQFVIDSDAPAKALAALAPYLEHETLKQLEDEALKSP